MSNITATTSHYEAYDSSEGWCVVRKKCHATFIVVSGPFTDEAAATAEAETLNKTKDSYGA